MQRERAIEVEIEVDRDGAGWEPASTEATAFFNLVLGITFHHGCCISTIVLKDITQKHEC